MNKYLISVSGVAMALVLSSTALGAVTVFTGGTPILAAPMNANFANLNGNLTDGACIGAMTRVGPTCVDNIKAAVGATWVEAVAACRTAGKRLLTPGEFMAAKAAGVTGTSVNGELEWVDQVSSDASADSTLAGGHAGRMVVSYMGPDSGANITAGDIFFGNNAAYDAGFDFIHFRCAR